MQNRNWFQPWGPTSTKGVTLMHMLGKEVAMHNFFGTPCSIFIIIVIFWVFWQYNEHHESMIMMTRCRFPQCTQLFLAAFCQFLATCDNFWKLLTTCGNIWQLLVTCGNLWQLVPTCGNLLLLFLFCCCCCFVFVVVLFLLLFCNCFRFVVTNWPTFLTYLPDLSTWRKRHFL